MPRVPSDWISLSAAAQIPADAHIPVSTSTLACWAHTGELQSVQPGRQIYVRRAQVRSLLQPRKHKGANVESLQPGLFEDLDE